MAANKRTAIEIEQNRSEIARLYLQGETQAEIAARLGMTQPMVSYDLKAIQEQWRASSIRDIDEAKTRELAKIDAVEREYWQAWETSKETHESTVTEKTTTPATTKTDNPTPIKERTKAQIRKETRTGDPRYLAGVMTCIERRAKLLGLDTPVKTEGEMIIRVVQE